MSAIWHWLTQGGPGGVPGDIVATYICVVISFLIAGIFWPPLRRLAWRLLGLHALHAKLDHIILNHPGIPNVVPGLADEHQPKQKESP